MSATATRLVVQKKHKRYVNQDWTANRYFPKVRGPNELTKFEEFVERHKLPMVEWCFSEKLKAWVEVNKNRYYVPEWLLNYYGMTVEEVYS